jgi:putative SOS response-associated peptidase YedK
MCGRFTITKKQQALAERYNAEIEGVINEIYNAAPSQKLPVVTNEAPDKIKLFRWGLIPSSARDMSIGNKLINAQAETLLEKPSYKENIKRHRCLVPADGFYEWKKLGRTPQPYRITMQNEDLFSFAGLWDEWQDTIGNTFFSFTVITTTANSLIQPIHSRMPVILEPELEKYWLDNSLPMDDVLNMLKPYSSDKMKYYPVSKAVNSALVNSPDLITPVKIDGGQLTLF